MGSAGFLRGMEREYRREAAEGTRKAKRLLYAYRVALTGAHLLRTGELVNNVLNLYERYDFPNVPGLVELKHVRGRVRSRSEMSLVISRISSAWRQRFKMRRRLPCCPRSRRTKKS